MATSPVPYPEKKLGRVKPIYSRLWKGCCRNSERVGGGGLEKTIIGIGILASAELSFLHPSKIPEHT